VHTRRAARDLCMKKAGGPSQERALTIRRAPGVRFSQAK
jgi:hypothetical protein